MEVKVKRERGNEEWRYKYWMQFGSEERKDGEIEIRYCTELHTSSREAGRIRWVQANVPTNRDRRRGAIYWQAGSQLVAT